MDKTNAPFEQMVTVVVNGAEVQVSQRVLNAVLAVRGTREYRSFKRTLETPGVIEAIIDKINASER